MYVSFTKISWTFSFARQLCKYSFIIITVRRHLGIDSESIDTGYLSISFPPASSEINRSPPMAHLFFLFFLR